MSGKKCHSDAVPSLGAITTGIGISMPQAISSEQMQDLKEQLKEQLGDQRGIIREAVTQAHEAARRARDDARRAADQLRIFFEDDGAVKASKIDLGKAQIVFSDDKGELKLANVDGRKLLTVKDPQGKLLFSGPVETKEDLDKMPADVRERYNRLQQNDLPTVSAAIRHR